MTFYDTEVSNAAARPIILYDFWRGITHWRYCTADRAISYSGQPFEPVAISDSGVLQTGDTDADTFDVTLPTETAVAQLFVGTPPSDGVRLVVRRMHFGETDAPIVWVGKVVTRNQKDTAESVLSCQSLISSLASNGLRLGFQRTCPHMLYDTECRVNKNAFSSMLTVAGAGGPTVTLVSAGGRPDGWFSGGFLEWYSDDGGLEQRMIRAHSGTTLTMSGRTDGITPGLTVFVYPGCDRTGQTCNDKFSNIDNYGGILHLPGSSPFSGQKVF